jgi:hypothetical protein
MITIVIVIIIITTITSVVVVGRRHDNRFHQLRAAPAPDDGRDGHDRAAIGRSGCGGGRTT